MKTLTCKTIQDILIKVAYPPKCVTVTRWEKNHPEFFRDLKLECSEDCKCGDCFQKALDCLVAKTEAAANDTGNGFGVNDELASDELSQRPSTDGFDSIQHFNGC